MYRMNKQRGTEMSKIDAGLIGAVILGAIWFTKTKYDDIIETLEVSDNNFKQIDCKIREMDGKINGQNTNVCGFSIGGE